MNATDAALICRALGDPNRLQIVQTLSGGEMCACKLLEHFEITQPTLSHHMKILCESGIVVARKEGKWTYYSISEKGSVYAGNLLKELTMPNTAVEENNCCK